MSLVIVKTAAGKIGGRVLTIEGTAGVQSRLTLGRFALVGPGDHLRIRHSGPFKFVDLKEASRDSWIPIFPGYQADEQLLIGDEKFQIRVSEIEDSSQLQAYERLESFHYKGRSLDEDPNSPTVEQKGVGGRKAVLIASLRVGKRVRVVGYLELQMPLMMCKPRHDLFSLPFAHKVRGVSWETWLGDGQQHVNLIVRIARVVVDPEFRGLGLSTMLVRKAKEFAASRWSIGGNRPLFIEISAEMLRYMDFVSKAGIRFAGATEGNLERILKDLRSIERGAKGQSQIMGLQKKYHILFSAYCRQTKRSFNEASAILSELLTKKNVRTSIPSDEWLAFRPLLRFPIPYHIAGLDSEAESYISKCLQETTRKNEIAPDGGKARKIAGRAKATPVQLKCTGLEIWMNHSLSLTPYVRLAMDSFGIDSARLRTKLVGPVDVDLVRGNVALITGSSGAGKSVMLEALSGKQPADGLLVKGQRKSTNAKVASPRVLPPKTPVLQYFGKKYGAELAFDTLCRVGLSEAMVFIKPFELLSVGQKYRAMLADLLLREADIWLIDEYCSNLDPVTAAIISTQLRRLARRLGVIVVVAAANCAHFVDSLRPDQIFVVRTGGDVHRFTTKEFKNGFFEKGL